MILIEDFFNNKLPKILHNIDTQVAVFMGAGLSQPYGCSSWQNLGYSVIEACKENGMSYITAQTIFAQEQNFKTMLTIGKRFLYKHHNNDNIFLNCIKKSLNHKDNAGSATEWSPIKEGSTEGVYRHLKNIFSYFITTNADRHIDNFFKENIIYKNDFSTKLFEGNLAKDHLYKIHGCISDPESMVFTTDQYLKAYQVNNGSNATLGTFLGDVFRRYRVVFIGYGLSEFELLERLIHNEAHSNNKGHYIIRGYYKHQQEMIEAYDLYYEALGVEQVIYYLDEIGHKELSTQIQDYHNKKILDNNKPLESLRFIDDTMRTE